MAQPASPRRRWLRWVLVASLGLNLSFVGLIGGALLKGPPPVPGIWHYARALPDPYRRDLGRALRDTRRDWAGPRQALRGQQDALATALTADPFDPDAVAALLEDETRITGDLARRGTDMLMAQITRMSPAERAAYAEALRAERRRGPGRRP